MLLLQASCPAHYYHAVQSAHKSLRVPPVMSQVMECRSLKRSRRSHSLSSYCVGEVIVQGDEGPVVGVAQGVHCHGVTVSHEEKEEEEVEQEVESDGEKTLKERCACPWMG